MLHQALTLAENKTPRGDVAVGLHLAPGLPPIDADHHRLCQVFTNLLTNAFEAMNGRGTVDITVAIDANTNGQSGDEAEAPAPTVIVDVTDDGPGVPQDLSDRLFDPFFTTKPQGSGLGLPIVRKIVDAHDGRIDLVSRPGHGTRFRVTLPVATSSAWFK